MPTWSRSTRRGLTPASGRSSSQIDSRLDSVEKGIDKIAEFQDVEYQSRVHALIAAVRKSSAFRLEVMESDELRQRELGYLKERENECSQLLAQANIMLEKIATRKGLDFEGYGSAVTEANTWYQYQQILLKIMAELSKLTYALNMGAISRENSYAMLAPYTQQADNSLKKLRMWHSENEKRLEIDTSASKRRR